MSKVSVADIPQQPVMLRMDYTMTTGACHVYDYVARLPDQMLISSWCWGRKVAFSYAIGKHIYFTAPNVRSLLI